MMTIISDTEVISRLFSDHSNIGDLLNVLNSSCFTVNQRFKYLLRIAITKKEFQDGLDTEISKASATLQSRLCKELCASYGDQQYVILDIREKVIG